MRAAGRLGIALAVSVTLAVLPGPPCVWADPIPQQDADEAASTAADATFDDSETRLRQAVAGLDGLSGRDAESERSLILEQLGQLLDRQGRGREANEAFRQALLALPATVDEDPARTLAQDLRGLSDYAAAEAADRVALLAHQSRHREPDSEEMELLTSLGNDLQWLRRFDEAAAAYHRAIEIGERALGPDAAAIASPLEHLGDVLAIAGTEADAARAFVRAAGIAEASSQPDAATLGRLGNALYALGECAAAAKAHDAAIRAEADADDAAVADLFNRLGLDLYWDGQIAAAVPAHRRALAIRDAALGPDHPLTTDTMLNLVYDLSDSGAGSEALRLVRRAVTAAESAEDPWSSAIAAADAALGHVLRGLGRAVDAEAPLSDARAICEHSCGTAPMLRARVLAESTATSAVLGRRLEADALLRQTMFVLDHDLGRASPEANGLRRIAAP